MQTIVTLVALVKRLKFWILGLFLLWVFLTFAIEKWRTDRDFEDQKDSVEKYVGGHQSKEKINFKQELVQQDEWKQTFNRFQWKAAHNSIERFVFFFC